MAKFLVTTIDNPFNPFTQFNEWYVFDRDHGYHTCAYLARIANVSNELSEADYESAVNDAVDEIVRLNITGMYIRVEQNEPTTS